MLSIICRLLSRLHELLTSQMTWWDQKHKVCASHIVQFFLKISSEGHELGVAMTHLRRVPGTAEQRLHGALLGGDRSRQHCHVRSSNLDRDNRSLHQTTSQQVFCCSQMQACFCSIQSDAYLRAVKEHSHRSQS